MNLKDVLTSLHMYYDGPERRKKANDFEYRGFDRRNLRPTCLMIAGTVVLGGLLMGYILLTHEPHFPDKKTIPTIESVYSSSYTTGSQRLR